jgi:hypothetical protein
MGGCLNNCEGGGGGLRATLPVSCAPSSGRRDAAAVAARAWREFELPKDRGRPID